MSRTRWSYVHPSSSSALAALWTPYNRWSNFDATDVQRLPDGSCLGSQHAGCTSARWPLLKALGHHCTLQADQGEERRHCRGLVISEADWSSAAHSAQTMVMPRAELVAPAMARHVEELGRLQLIPPRVTERPGTQLPLHHGQRCGVKSIRNAGWRAAKALGGRIANGISTLRGVTASRGTSPLHAPRPRDHV
jgi:hypothetical protein